MSPPSDRRPGTDWARTALSDRENGDPAQILFYKQGVAKKAWRSLAYRVSQQGAANASRLGPGLGKLRSPKSFSA